MTQASHFDPSFIALQEKVKELEKENSLLKDLYHQAPLSYQSLDRQGCLLDINQEWLDTLGYTREEVLGQNFSDFLPPEQQNKFKECFARFQEKNEVFGVELQMIKKDQSIIKIRCHGKISQNIHDEVKRTHCIFQDVTKEDEVKSLLKKSETNYQLLVDNQTDMLTKVDTDGNFLFVSPSYCKMFNKKETEVIGKKHSPLIHEEDRELTVDALKNATQPPYTTYYQHRALTQDGWKWFSWHNSAILNDTGKVTEIISVGREISQFKRSEEEREKLQEQVGQSHKMEAVGRLAGGIAHDYNNMLNVIIGHTEMALDDFSITPTLRLGLEQILSAAHHSSDITRQLLAFARQQTTISTVLNINSIIDNIVPMATRLLGSDINFSWSPTPDLWETKTDPTQIDQVVLNLCINARDAIKNTGAVVIETSNTTLDEESCSEIREAYPGEFVTIVVQDTGIGIAKDKLNQIFDPFYTTKETGTGTGLGLASVYGIIKQNKGFINVYSKLDEGTSFELYIPRYVKKEETPPSATPQPTPQGNGELILLVEDEIAILNLGKRILEKLGYVVVTASSPAEALAWVKEHSTRIDLILTDVVMPNMNGKEMAEKIQEQYPHLKSKTLYMSGYASEVIVNRGLLTNEIQFIQKPFTQNGLATQISAVLGNND